MLSSGVTSDEENRGSAGTETVDGRSMTEGRGRIRVAATPAYSLRYQQVFMQGDSSSETHVAGL